jgi:putative oxidoreductase
MKNLSSPILERRAFVVLRIAVALLLIIHGIARIWLGIVDDFGDFLDSLGFPFGVVIAWIITLVEIGGGITLAVGFFVRPLAIWFAVQLLIGIALVHVSEGWFVVGAGRNGMEYSVLLIVALALLAWTNIGRTTSGAAGL